MSCIVTVWGRPGGNYLESLDFALSHLSALSDPGDPSLSASTHRGTLESTVLLARIQEEKKKGWILVLMSSVGTVKYNNS